MASLLRTLSGLNIGRNNQMILRPSSSSSSRSTPEQDNELNRLAQQEVEIANIERALQNWSIPLVKKKEIYKQHSIFTHHDDTINSIECCQHSSDHESTIKLLDENLINKHISEGYSYIHIGLIQVAAKPNFRLGINSPIIIMLRDTRFKKFADSIISVLESNLHDGPAFFNCYPNYSMVLNNNWTKDAMQLKLLAPDDIFEGESDPFSIIYRIHYKVSKLNHGFRALRSSPKNETIMIEANLKKSSIQVPKRLTHEEIISKIPEEWVFKEILPAPKVENTQVREIVQEGNNIRLRINRSQSFTIREPQTVRAETSRASVDYGSTINLRGLDNSQPGISQPVYQDSNMSSSPHYSPTTSQIMNTLTKVLPFEIDKKWIQEDFKAEYNKPLRDWYFSTFSKEHTTLYRSLYYQYMQEKEINLYFFDWFSEYNKIHNIIDSCSINPLIKRTNKWKTTEDTIIESEYPPTSGVKIQATKDVEVEASPYKIIKNEDSTKFADKKDINKIHQQLNYSNTMLSTMSSQLTRIESQNDHYIPKNEASSSRTVVSIEPVKPIYKLSSISQKDLESIKFGDSKIDEIRRKLESLSLGKSSINTLELNRMGKARNYPPLKNYYPRPTYPDIQFEERGELVQNHFSGSGITEWNKDV